MPSFTQQSLMFLRAAGSALGAARAAFRKAYLSTSKDALNREQFTLYRARLLRYALYEALWENTAYESGPFGIHSWANAWKTSNGLYKYTKGLYNPSNRLVEFWATHLMGGELDLDAGDGVNAPSALPIITPTDNPELRQSLGRHLWPDSRWRTKKTVWCRHGAMLGDAVLKVAVDARKGKVRLQPIHPRTLVELDQDDDGEVLGYRIQETRVDPDRNQSQAFDTDPITCTFTEVCEKQTSGVAYLTLKDGKPYNWRGVGADGKPLPSEWEAPWPFVPLVANQHIDLGMDFGASELLAAVAKIAGGDDGGSKLLDHLRRAVETRWFFAGIAPRDLVDSVKVAREATAESPYPGREDEVTISAKDKDAKVTAMLANLNLADAQAVIDSINSVIERDYPELAYDRVRLSGDASGSALREARKPVVTRVNERRDGYDQALVKAQAMALAIGGELGFPGYESFDLTDWDTPRLSHSIGSRTVFEVDAIDRAEEDLAEAQAVTAWTSAGVPLEVALERAEWPKERIQRVLDLQAQAETRMLANQQTLIDAGAAMGGGQ